MMGSYLGALVDFIHAVALLAWVLGLPILFFAKSEKLRRAYGAYAIGFIVLSWASRFLLGACFLTRISTALWQSGAPPTESAPETWFTVRFAETIFHMRPREDSIVFAWYALVLVSCVGLFVHARRSRRAAKTKTDGALVSDDASSSPLERLRSRFVARDRRERDHDPVRAGAVGAAPLPDVRDPRARGA